MGTGPDSDPKKTATVVGQTGKASTGRLPSADRGDLLDEMKATKGDLLHVRADTPAPKVQPITHVALPYLLDGGTNRPYDKRFGPEKHPVTDYNAAHIMNNLMRDYGTGATLTVDMGDGVKMSFKLPDKPIDLTSPADMKAHAKKLGFLKAALGDVTYEQKENPVFKEGKLERAGSASIKFEKPVEIQSRPDFKPDI